MPAVQQVRQSVTIENGEESAKGFCQNRFQFADCHNGAGIRFGIEAFHDVQVYFGATDYCSKIDNASFPGERDPARTAGTDRNIPVLTERPNDSNQMVAGNSVDLADFVRGDDATGGLATEVEKNA